MKKCTHLGCLKQYNEEENFNGACIYHDGKPIFHDIKKGWTCCNQIVYDWDEFQKLKGCKIGSHTDVKSDITFFKNPDNQNVTNKETTIVKNENTPIVKNISEYEKEAQRKKEEELNLIKDKPLEYIKNSDGKVFCLNPGCKDKVFSFDENNDDSCKYHIGKPVFHDLKKYWTCCKVETWDWDEFLKIPTCAVGKHTPKCK